MWQISQLPINRFGNIEIPAFELNVLVVLSFDFHDLVHNYVLPLTLSDILGVFRKIFFKWTQVRGLFFLTFCPTSSFNVHFYSVRVCSWFFLDRCLSGCLFIFGLRFSNIFFSSFSLSFTSSQTSKSSSLVAFLTICTFKFNVSTNFASLWSKLSNIRFVDFHFIYTCTKNPL